MRFDDMHSYDLQKVDFASTRSNLIKSQNIELSAGFDYIYLQDKIDVFISFISPAELYGNNILFYHCQ